VDIVWLIVAAMFGAACSWFVLSRRPAQDGASRSMLGEPTAATVSPKPLDAPSTDEEEHLERLRQALDALDLWVFISDADGEVVVRNRSALVGSTGALHTDVLVREAADAMLEQARGGRRVNRVLELFGPPSRVVVVNASPLANGGAIATVEDATERSRLESVRTDFVANVSHELKTPVGAIAVLAEALVDETDLDVVSRFAAKMVGEAHRMGNTIDDLLELSRIELGGETLRQHVDVPLVVAEAVERVDAEATQRHIEVAVECDPDASVEGDARQILSALGNLVENAVKYSDDGATVRVTARTTDTGVEIQVSDTGAGIPARDLDRIFERFYRVDRARSRGTGGTGLGLSIVRHVATNHGGKVTVTSREGEGSTFTLTLPSGSLGARK
jgi:two-component system, OmpR family, sensor histidine kinase SenX3